MEDRESSGGIFNGTYNKIISQEDFGTDEHPLYSNQEKQQGMKSEWMTEYNH